MTSVEEVRASINQTPDRWEAAALALEENVEATLAVVAERLQRRGVRHRQTPRPSK
jgi:hypothetical protein